MRENRNKGQIVVEYILLLVIGVALALIITRLMVNRSNNPAEQGFLIKKWYQIVETIGSDKADDIER